MTVRIRIRVLSCKVNNLSEFVWNRKIYTSSQGVSDPSE